MSLSTQIKDYIHAAFSGLWVQTLEPDEAERELARLAKQEKWTIAFWDVASGLRVRTDGKSSEVENSAGDPLAALRALPALAKEDGTTLLVLHQFHRFLGKGDSKRAKADKEKGIKMGYKQ